MSPLQLVGNAALWAATIPAVLFVVLYARSRWEDSQIGRQTMAMSFSIALVLTLSVFRTIIGDSPLYQGLRVMAFLTIIPTFWWRVVILLRAQRQGVHSGNRREECAMEPDHGDALEANMGTLGDEEYFEHLERAKAEGVHGVDPEGNVYQVDEGVQDLRGEK